MDPNSTTTPTTKLTTPPIHHSTSKHLILFLLIVFPPLAWYYMWKEHKYHNWFASVLMIDGLIFLGTSILLLFSVYPPLMKIYDSLAIPHSLLYKLIPYSFVIVGIVEIAFGIYLKFQVKKHHALSSTLLVITILLLFIHLIGLPLGQIISYFSVASTFKDLDKKYQQLLPDPAAHATPVPSVDQTSISPTCQPRPACLDLEPRCMIPETSDMCPKPTTSTVMCTQDAKLCPDGSYVSRTGPNCEFTPCPK